MGIIASIDVGLTAGLPANIPLPGKDHGALFYLQSLPGRDRRGQEQSARSS